MPPGRIFFGIHRFATSSTCGLPVGDPFFQAGSADSRESVDFLITTTELNGQGRSTHARGLDATLDPERVWIAREGHASTCLRYDAVHEAIEQAMSGADYCVILAARYALIVDYHRRAAREFLEDPSIAVLRNDNPSQAMRPVLRYLVPGLDAVHVHAAALHDPRHGALMLMGPSGAGKSTAASLREPDQRVLGDDRVVVTRRTDGFWVEATPFNRVTSGPGAGPLRGLAWLRKGPCFALERVPWMRLLSDVWHDNAREWWHAPLLLRRRVFALYADLLRDVPLFELTFAKDFIDWNRFREAISEDQVSQARHVQRVA